MVQVAQERGPEEKGRRAEIVAPKTHNNIGLEIDKWVASLSDGGANKNVRFAALANLLVNDAIGNFHRVQASTEGANAVKKGLNIEFKSKLVASCFNILAMVMNLIFGFNGVIMENSENVLYRGEKIKLLVDIDTYEIVKDKQPFQGTDMNNNLLTWHLALAQATKIFAYSAARSELEQVDKIVTGLFEKCIEIVHKCIDDAKMEKWKVDDVVVVEEVIAWSLTFIDELHSIACKWKTHVEVHMMIVSKFFTLMDGLKSHAHPIVFCATSCLNSIYLARRFGSFDRKIDIGVSETVARSKILFEGKTRELLEVLHFKQWDPGGMFMYFGVWPDLFIKEVKSTCSIAREFTIWLVPDLS